MLSTKRTARLRQARVADTLVAARASLGPDQQVEYFCELS